MKTAVMKSAVLSCMGLSFFALLALGVAAPGDVWGQDRYRHYEPGSVLVFPKFLTGTVPDNDGSVWPRSSFEISVICPPGLDPRDTLCAPNLLTGIRPAIYLKAKWVCPPQVTTGTEAHLCRARDFHLQTTVNGTLWINPENIPNIPVPGGAVTDPFPPSCENGFLIVWAVNNHDQQLPISFNGLLGNAILRPSPITHVMAYNAYSIQAANDLLPGVETGAPKDELNFNGTFYRELTDRFYGTVRYGDANTRTFITLLSLDITAGTNNNTDADDTIQLLWYNENEVEHSDSTQLICWKEIEVPSAKDVESTIGKGLVSVWNQSRDTVMGLIRTEELIPGVNPSGLLRGYAYSVYNDRETQENACFLQLNNRECTNSVPAPAIAGQQILSAPSLPVPAPAVPTPGLPLPGLLR